MLKLDECDQAGKNILRAYAAVSLQFVASDNWDMQVAHRRDQHETMEPGAISWGKICAEPEELMACIF